MKISRNVAFLLLIASVFVARESPLLAHSWGLSGYYDSFLNAFSCDEPVEDASSFSTTCSDPCSYGDDPEWWAYYDNFANDACSDYCEDPYAPGHDSTTCWYHGHNIFDWEDQCIVECGCLCW